ncbi:MAG: outer membrane beta-barrel protein [Bacteroidales bacterium]
MMKKEFSDEQIREMRDILTGHEEEYVEGAWENFDAMRRRKKLIYRLSATGVAAALVLGFLGISVLSQPDTSLPIVADNVEQPVVVVEQPVVDADRSVVNKEVTLKDVIDQKVTTRGVVAQNVVKQDVAAKNITAQNVVKQSVAVQNVVSQDVVTKNGEVQNVESQNISNQIVANQIVATHTAETRNVESQSIANQNIANQNEKASNDSVKLLPAQRYNFDEGRMLNERKSPEKRIRLGVNLSPGVNTTASSSTFNYSGGVNVEIKLAKNLQLSTGVQLEHQDVDNRSTVRSMSQPAMEAGAVVTYLPPSHISASITNLDIPLNIKWNFINKRSTGYYVAAGISSLAYLRESYQTTTYRQELREKTLTEGTEKITTFGLENVPTITTNTVSQSRTPDIAGRFNLIFGIEQRISPTLRLHVEPFMKIPLTGLATENLMFTTGGVTFKVSF